MQKHVNLVDLVKSFPTHIYLQNLASIQKRTSPVKFAHLAEKSGKGSISNLSTKVDTPPSARQGTMPACILGATFFFWSRLRVYSSLLLRTLLQIVIGRTVAETVSHGRSFYGSKMRLALFGGIEMEGTG